MCVCVCVCVFICVCVCVCTLGCSDLGYRQGSSYVDQPTAMRHLVLRRILTEVIIIYRVNKTQVEQQPVQHLDTHINHKTIHKRVLQTVATWINTLRQTD